MDTTPQEGQPTENVDTSQDKSLNNPDPTVAPTSPEAAGVGPDSEPEEDGDPFSLRVVGAVDNLAPSEVIPPSQVGAVLGVLLYAHDNDGELPGPLHERFPDSYPDPND